MEQKAARELLEKVANGAITVEDAVLKLKEAPFEDLGFAKLDNHRSLRQGMSEVIYGAGKTPQQIIDIVKRGHRVELHIHPHWCDAVYKGDGTWDFSNFQHYSLNSFSKDSSLYKSITFTSNFSCNSGNFENSISSPICMVRLFSSYNLNSTVLVPFFILSNGSSCNFILCNIFSSVPGLYQIVQN